MAGTASRIARGPSGGRGRAAATLPVVEELAKPDVKPEPRELKLRWEAYLAAKHLNTTAQREAIVDQFFRAPEHISIEELLGRVRRRHAKVGYATVYRTLKLLVDAGLASERQFGDGQARYEVAGQHHDHLICAKCGLILEFEDDEIERLQERIAQRLGGFTVIRHRHELYALCPRERGIDDRCPGQRT
jgi:Fur family transcriptional regulator, ferric uptake regulator